VRILPLFWRCVEKPSVSPSPRLGVLSLTALGVNTIVGSGIFRLPAELASALGPASVLANLAGALLLAPIALCYAEAASVVSGDGGAYVYARSAFGARAGFVVGWSMWLGCVLTFAVAAVAVPGQIEEVFAPAARREVALAVVAFIVIALGVVNWASARTGARASDAFAIVKVVPLVAFVVVGAAFVSRTNLQPIAPRGWSGFGPALLPVMFALSGFESSATPGALAKDARRSVPVAAVAAVALTAVLYGLIQLVAVGVVPNLGESKRPLADVMRTILGPQAAALVSLVGAVAMIGLSAAMAFAGPRLLAALATDGHLPVALGRMSAGGAPHASILVTTLATALLAVTLDFRHLVDFTTIILVIQYSATCAAVLKLRARHVEGRITLPLGPVLPVCGIAIVGWIGMQASRRELLLSLVALVVGVVLSELFRRFGSSPRDSV